MKYLKYIDYGEQSSPLKVISLHGFPSVRSKQNREIAEGIAGRLQCRVRVILYPGLSCDGVFSFTKTIDALVEEFQNFSETGPDSRTKIDLLGHSFGGFAALLLAATYPQSVRSLVLLSPLLRFNPTIKDVTGFFQTILNGCRDANIKTLSPDALAREFHELSKVYRSEELIDQLNPNLEVHLLQARVDSVTPTAVAEDFRKQFKCGLHFELVDQDHSFLIDRPALASKIARLLN